MNLREEPLGELRVPSVSRASNRGFSSRNWLAIASDVLPLCDLLCCYLVVYFGVAFGVSVAAFLPLSLDSPLAAENNFRHWAPAIAVLAAFILYDSRFGSIAGHGRVSMLVRSHVLRFAVFAAVAVAIGAVSGSLSDLPISWLIIWLFESLVLTSLTRWSIARYMRYLQRQGALTEVVAVIGAGPLADRLVHALRQAQPNGIEVLGVFDDKINGAVPSEIKSSGSLATLIDRCKTRKIDWILLTLPPTAEQRLASIVQRLKSSSMSIGLCPQYVGLGSHRIADLVGNCVPVGMLADRPIKRWDAVTKASEDFVLGGIVTLLLLPVLAVIALAIKLDSRGPVVFKQRRHTFNNSEFDIYKFRTMRWNPALADTTLRQASRRDERVTRVGRFLRASSLDELPQLFNVLQGQMSLVGPRPHAINMRTENRLGHEITDLYAHRHRVKPGITGWSQVNGARGATATVEQLRRRVELDLHYIDNWSLLLDLKILALTPRVVIDRTNAF